MAGGPLQAADDMVRIIANGMTFGLADRLASAAGEKDTAGKTAAAGQRAGLAGDVGSVLGFGGGVKAGFAGLKAVPKIIKAVASKKGAAAGALGLGTLLSYNGRTNQEAAKAAAPAPKAAAPKAGAKAGTANADRVTDQIMSALNAVDSQPPTYADLAQQLSASQGGVSLRQLGVLAEAEQRATPKATKVTPPNYAVTARLQSYYDGLHAQEIASGVPQGEADANWAARYQDLLKLDPLNPMLRDSDEEN